MNKNYETLRNNVMYTIRTSELELGAIYYIMKDVLNDIERSYSSVIQQEIQAEAQAEAEAQAKAESEDNAEGEEIDL